MSHLAIVIVVHVLSLGEVLSSPKFVTALQVQYGLSDNEPVQLVMAALSVFYLFAFLAHLNLASAFPLAFRSLLGASITLAMHTALYVLPVPYAGWFVLYITAQAGAGITYGSSMRLVLDSLTPGEKRFRFLSFHYTPESLFREILLLCPYLYMMALFYVYDALSLQDVLLLGVVLAGVSVFFVIMLMACTPPVIADKTPVKLRWSYLVYTPLWIVPMAFLPIWAPDPGDREWRFGYLVSHFGGSLLSAVVARGKHQERLSITMALGFFLQILGLVLWYGFLVFNPGEVVFYLVFVGLGNGMQGHAYSQTVDTREYLGVTAPVAALCIVFTLLSQQDTLFALGLLSIFHAFTVAVDEKLPRHKQ